MTDANGTTQQTKPTDKDVVNMGDLNVGETKAAAGAVKDAPAVEMQEVKIGEKAFSIPKDVAIAFEQAKQAGVAVEELKAQISQLSQKAAPVKDDAATGELGLDVLLFSDPTKAIEKLTGMVTEKVTADLNRTKAQEQFWTEFYSQNKELKDHDGYVRFVFAREYKDMTKSGMTVQQAITKLGDSVKADILKLAPKGGKSTKQTAEGGEGTKRTDAVQSEGGEGELQSTASILAARREARRQAARPSRKTA